MTKNIGVPFVEMGHPTVTETGPAPTLTMEQLRAGLTFPGMSDSPVIVIDPDGNELEAFAVDAGPERVKLFTRVRIG